MVFDMLIYKILKVKNMKKYLMLLMLFSMSIFVSAQDDLKDWFMLDYEKDKVPGISANRAYEELLKGRKSEPVIVAVIDGGVDYMHEDLKDVMWRNPGEIEGNGIDDDKNGYIDDVYGWNFIGGANGKNVNQDNLEVARLYKKLQYKYKTADPKKLSKKNRKEYKLWEKVRDDLEKNRQEAAENADKFSQKQKKVSKALDLVQSKLDEKELTFEQLDSLDVSTDTLLEKGVDMINNITARNPNVASIEEVKKMYGDYFERVIGYYAEKIKFHYNPDFDSRKIVGDNYKDSKERFYGNPDVKGPDALHGTHVAGIIAATRNNGLGMNGVADNVKIMAIRVVPNGDERDKDVANGIRYAADNGASIINMSFGKNYSWDKKIVDKAVKYAQKKGVLLIHAAGNNAEDNDEVLHYPTDDYEKQSFWKSLFSKKKAKNWLDIGANSYSNDSMFVASFSNYGENTVDVFAPGVAIYATAPENNYRSLQGTSMATPVVAGVAAVLKSYFPKLKAKEIKKIIMESSTVKDMPVYMPGGDKKVVNFKKLSISGGEVNLYNAIKMAIEKYNSKAAK